MFVWDDAGWSTTQRCLEWNSVDTRLPGVNLQCVCMFEARLSGERRRAAWSETVWMLDCLEWISSARVCLQRSCLVDDTELPGVRQSGCLAAWSESPVRACVWSGTVWLTTQSCLQWNTLETRLPGVRLQCACLFEARLSGGRLRTARSGTVRRSSQESVGLTAVGLSGGRLRAVGSGAVWSTHSCCARMCRTLWSSVKSITNCLKLSPYCAHDVIYVFYNFKAHFVHSGVYFWWFILLYLVIIQLIT